MINYKKYSIIDGPLTAKDLKAIHGANYFSGDRVIVILLDLGIYDEVTTNKIEFFYEKLVKAIPSLYEHHCSPGHPGGFFERVKEGTLLGHVTEHIAIELQTLAGMDVGFGKTRKTRIPGLYNIVFRFADEVAGFFAAKAAVNIVNAILNNQSFDLADIIHTLIHIREDRVLGPSTQAIFDEAVRRKIPCKRLDEHNLLQLGSGKYLKRTRATISSDTNHIAIETADNKYLANLMLSEAGLPVPQTKIIESFEQAVEFMEKVHKSIVIKPVYGSSGEGITLSITNQLSVPSAIDWASSFSNDILAQEFIEGSTYRLLIIDYELVAAVKMVPVILVGDGKKTISELITEINSNPKRQFGDKSRLSIIEIDDITEHLLKMNRFSIDSILKENQEFAIKISGSLKNGGSAIDITDQVHEFNRFSAERAAKIIGLNVAGIDIICNSIRESIADTKGCIVEVNAAPDFRMHLKPTHGIDRNVAKPFVNMLFPDDTKRRIPIFAITGSKGKTSTVNLLAYILELNSLNTGKVTDSGFFIKNQKLNYCKIPNTYATNMILKDPTLDAAVIEVTLEGIIEGGLGYDFADFGIVLNVNDIYNLCKLTTYLHDLEDVAYAKSVVAEQVYDEGFTILNADDNLVIQMRKRLYSNLILISADKKNSKLKAYKKKGGIVYFLDENQIVRYSQGKQEVIIDLEEVPLFR
ncbi:MAG: Mur ligase family protein, partial [Candidatus Cloacimonetes bacterium]|nr:Mur ligase family protein [Candidatus Cloacimonadota bacterium]